MAENKVTITAASPDAQIIQTNIQLEVSLICTDVLVKKKWLCAFC